MLQAKNQPKRTGGFTLLEVLMSIAIITALAAVSLPVFQNFQVRNDLHVAATTVAQSLRRAQTLAQASDGDISWGLKIQANSIVIFKGPNYAGRDTSYDEIFDLPGDITPSGLGEVVFAKFTGDPSTTGTVTLTSSTNETINLSLNTRGTVTY